MGTGVSKWTFGLGAKLITAPFECRILKMLCKGFLANISVEKMSMWLYERTNICQYHVASSMGCIH